MGVRLRDLPTAVFLLAAVAGCSRQHDQFDPVRQRIRDEIMRQRVPSVSVAVARGSQILWEEAFGWADSERRVPATSETMYTLGSVSKPITATGLMVLRQRGVINLDRPVNDYLGETKVFARIGSVSEATVRRVAQHVGGLPGYYETFYPDDVDQPPTMDRVLQRYGLLVFPPGERFHYSNLDYGILGDVVSRASGESFGDFLRNQVFLPLGMNHSCVISCSGLEPYRATRYLRTGVPLPDYRTPHPGASDVYASAHDLVRFAMLQMKLSGTDVTKILSDESIDEMQTETVAMDGGAYGIGWVVNADSRGRRLSHGGAGAGVDTQLTVFLDQKVAVAVLVNTFTDPRVSEEITNAALDAVLGSSLLDRLHGMMSGLIARIRRRGGLPRDLEGAWTGTVRTPERDVPVGIRFDQSGDVEVQIADQAKTRIRAARFEDGMFIGDWAGKIGTPDANRRAYHLEWNLVLRGESLNGVLYAIGEPDSRGELLGYWTSLRKTQ